MKPFHKSPKETFFGMTIINYENSNIKIRTLFPLDPWDLNSKSGEVVTWKLFYYSKFKEKYTNKTIF